MGTLTRPHTGREREDASLSLASTPPPGDGGRLTAPPPGEENRKQEIIPPSRVPSLNHERHWRELREVWARPFLDDQREDRRAFDRAIEGGANPEDIVDAARAWVAAADAPRYLKPLAVWLDRRGWEVVPPKRGKTRAPRSNGRKPNLSNMFFAEGGYEEDDLGNMVWGGVS